MTTKMTKGRKTISVDIRLKSEIIDKDEDECLSVEINQGRKGGDFNLPLKGKVSLPANCLGKRDVLTFTVIPPFDRQDHMPPLIESEKLCSEIFRFSLSNGAKFKGTATLQLPHLDVDFNYYDLYVKMKDAGSAWTNVDDIHLDNSTQRVSFETQILDTFAIIGRLRLETFDIPPAGCIYNAKIGKYISVRFPKKATDIAIMCGIQIHPLDKGRLQQTKDENTQLFYDFKEVSNFFDFKHNGNKPDFKRQVTLKLPVPDYFGEEDQHPEEVAVLEKTDAGLWQIISSPIKITKQTMSFDVKHFSRYCIAKCKPQRHKRLEEVLPLIESNNTKIQSEVLTFTKLQEKRWRFLTAICPKENTENVKNKWLQWGWKEIAANDNNNNEADSTMFPRKRAKSRFIQQDKKTEPDDLNFTDGQKVLLQYSGEVKEVERHQMLNEIDEVTKDNIADPDNMDKETNDIKSKLGSIGIKQEKQEEVYQELYLVTSHQHCYRRYEIQPLSEDVKDLTLTIKCYTRKEQESVKQLKTFVVEIPAKMVHDYYYVEPEPEPEPEPVREPTPEPEEVIPVESPRQVVFRSFEGNESFMRLTAPRKHVIKIPRESRVMSGRSLMNLAREIEQGLTLAVYLDIPDSSITGIGFDALSNGLSLVDVTYKILLLWKRKTKKENQVEALAESFRQMGRRDVAEILIERHKLNMEITPDCFAY